MAVFDGSMESRIAFNNDNALKLGLFGINVSSGTGLITAAPERWSGTWPDNLKLARFAERSGLDFLLPLGRWKGYGGATDYQGTTMESVTWATAVLAKTERITVFATVHAPLINPVICAKELVTADLVGEGRLGLNIVCGWNQGEFEMFGVTQRDHEARYDYAQEWIDAIKTMWSTDEEFDFDGRYVSLRGVRAKPKPFGGTRPLLMNAGATETGQAFAVRNCDAFFGRVERDSVEEDARQVQKVKDLARAHGREIEFFSAGAVVCRPTKKEADEFYHHCTVDHADWGAIDNVIATWRPDWKKMPKAELDMMRQRLARGMGGVPIVGTPDVLVNQLVSLAAAGVRGFAMSLVNYGDELPYICDEVLPRLAEKGLRATP